MKKLKNIEISKQICIASGNPQLSGFLNNFAQRLLDETDIETQFVSAEFPENVIVIDSQVDSFQSPVELSYEISACKAQLKSDDAFAIHCIGKGQMLIVSSSFSGTIDALVECYHQIKACVAHGRTVMLNDVCATPAVKHRFFHLSMSGSTPTLSALLEQIRTLKFLKYNGFVIEFENKFPYTWNNSFLHPDHYTLDDIRQIRETAKNFGIEIVPLLQCLGHLEYILKKEDFCKLCETPGQVDSACPLNPRTFELFTHCAQEIIAQFPDTNFFHIGADEVRVLGECPQCRTHVKKHGRFSTYKHYIKRTTEFLLDKKIQPMIWDDIIYRHYPHIRFDELSKKVIIVNWDYWAKDHEVGELLYTPDGDFGIAVSRERFFDTDQSSRDPYAGERIVHSANNIMEDYDWDEIGISEFIKTKDFPYDIQGFPVIEMIQKDGFIPAGAGAVRKSSDGSDQVRFVDRVLNVQAWCKKLQSARVDFFLTAAWARNNSLKSPVFNMELMLYSLAAGGYFAWKGSAKLTDYNDFFTNFLYSKNDKPTLNMTMVEIMQGLTSVRCDAFCRYAARNLDALKAARHPLYRMLYVYIRNFVFVRKHEGVMKNAKAVLYRMETEPDYPSWGKEIHLIALDELSVEIQELKLEAANILSEYIVPGETAELIMALYSYKEKEIAFLKNNITLTNNMRA